jgi:hypothetical protein
MGLDIHVMPIWRFWAGEYTTAAERFAEQTGAAISRVGQSKALYPPDESRQLAIGARRWVEQRIGQSEAWNDDGDIVFSEQFQFEAIHAVRAYAAHTECSEEPFAMTDDFHTSPAVRRILAGVPTDFPHLIRHEDNAGFYVPADFESPVKLMGQPPTIGSSVRLMIELAALRRRLGNFPDYSARLQGAINEEPHPGLAWVKHGVAFLYQACWLSVQSKLPIVIDG